MPIFAGRFSSLVLVEINVDFIKSQMQNIKHKNINQEPEETPDSLAKGHTLQHRNGVSNQFEHIIFNVLYYSPRICQ